MKTTKPKMTLATDSFYWTISDVTGGTREENLRSAPYALERLNKHAENIAQLASNQNAACLKDEHLQARIANVSLRIAAFCERYLPDVAKEQTELEAIRQAFINAKQDYITKRELAIEATNEAARAMNIFHAMRDKYAAAPFNKQAV